MLKEKVYNFTNKGGHLADKARWKFGNKKRKKLVFIVSVCLSILFLKMDEAYAVSQSQSEAVSWAESQIGKGLDYDGQYGNQCVDLIKYYYAYLGCADYARGNANEYAVNSLPAGWQRVYGNYQPGDIAVWKVNHSCSTCSTGSLGHVGIITSADSVGFNAVNQNNNGVSYCTSNWFYVSALQCAIRPDFGNGNPSVPVASLSYSAINVEWTDTWNALLKGTISNPKGLTVSNVGVWVWDSAGNMVVNHREECGLSTSTVNQQLNIVGEALPTGLRQGETYTFRMWADAHGTTYQSGTGSFTIKDDQAPVITNVYVSDLSETGYTVHCTVTDNFRVDRVQFPTWTLWNEQDDIVPDWGTNSQCSGIANGNSYTYRVNISEHNYEVGEYLTHIYAYDPAGNFSSSIAPVQVIETSQEQPGGQDSPTKPGNTENPTNPGISVDTQNPNKPGNSTSPSVPTKPQDSTTTGQEMFTIFFDGNGGTVIGQKSITRKDNQQLGKLPTAQRKGYLFRGWYLQKAGGRKISSYTRVSGSGSRTVYARWEKVAKPKRETITSLKKRGKGKFKVQYSGISKVKGYEICYSTNKKFKSSTKKAFTSSLAKTIKGLKKNKTYYVRVRGYRIDSTESRIYGKYSKVKKVKV